MDNNATMANDGATAVATDNNQALTEEQMEQMSEDELLTVFAEEMMKQKGLDSELDQDTYKTLLEDLKQRMEYQVNRAIVAQLTDEDLEKIGDKLENNTATAEDLDKVIAESNVDVAETTKDTLMTFREAYLGAGEEE
jgi:hypothetical protein